MATKQRVGVVLMALFLIIQGVILFLNIGGETAIGAEIHRKYYIYTRWWQLNWFASG